MDDDTLAEWFRHAPKPAPLPPGKRYHLFISYRSVNRAWVLKFYDVLKSLGYEPFLDQYALSAATLLASSLSDGLGQSQSAVMIWSSSFEDSEWCRREFNALEAKEIAGTGFRYVIAKVDGAPLPDLATGKLYIDFSADRDGPTGSGLLRLLYGLSNQPLPAEAVRLGAIADEQTRSADAQIQAMRMNGNWAGLVALSKTANLAWHTSSRLGCAVADALIGLKKPDLAVEVLATFEQRFPRALRPKQLRALALARLNKPDEAQQLLGELYASGEIDPETLGIYARTWMDRFNSSQKRLYLLKSRDLYRQAFEAAPNDFYTGINAASKSLLLGEAETAAQLAARVDQVLSAPFQGAHSYWRVATAAEAKLLRGDWAGAGAAYLDAVLIAPEDHGSHESSCHQAQLILKTLNAPTAAWHTVLAAFQHDGCEAPIIPS